MMTDARTLKARSTNMASWRNYGLDVSIFRPRDWRIDLQDLDRLIDSNTKPIALSAGSNGDRIPTRPEGGLRTGSLSRRTGFGVAVQDRGGGDPRTPTSVA